MYKQYSLVRDYLLVIYIQFRKSIHWISGPTPGTPANQLLLLLREILSLLCRENVQLLGAHSNEWTTAGPRLTGQKLLLLSMSLGQSMMSSVALRFWVMPSFARDGGKIGQPIGSLPISVSILPFSGLTGRLTIFPPSLAKFGMTNSKT